MIKKETITMEMKKFEELLDIVQAAQHLINHLSGMDNGKWLNNASGSELQTALKIYYE